MLLFLKYVFVLRRSQPGSWRPYLFKVFAPGTNQHYSIRQLRNDSYLFYRPDILLLLDFTLTLETTCKGLFNQIYKKQKIAARKPVCWLPALAINAELHLLYPVFQHSAPCRRQRAADLPAFPFPVPAAWAAGGDGW